jgi:hypothetical protein
VGAKRIAHETAPKKQMQIDFGQKKVRVGAAVVTVRSIRALPRPALPWAA